MSARQLIPVSERLGLSRSEAAEYVGISTGLFDMLVEDGRMPSPKQMNGRKVWSRIALERAFADLPDAIQQLVRERDVWDDAKP